MVFDIVDIIYKGFLIGILASIPLGPIALLCIQRTLNKGQWHGFFSGAGAALSDLFYAGIVSLGMGLIIDFITKNEYPLKIIGSIMMMIYGVYVFRSNPFKKLHEPKESGNSYWQNTISVFFLTLPNPLMIFFFIALFARFNFIASEEKLFSILLGLASILTGALSWWFLITFLVGKLHKKINLRVLWVINRILGVILIILSIYFLISLILPTAAHASSAGLFRSPEIIDTVKK